jgi:hypothetical protein
VPDDPPPGVGRWQIRLLCKQPTLIQDKEELCVPTMREVMDRCRVLIGRTSYMVNGPNREVLWAIDRWNTRTQAWVCMLNGKSRLARGEKPR